MKTSYSRFFSSISAAALLLVAQQANAEQFIGFGQAGAPGWALEAFPVIRHTAPNTNQIYSSFNPAYFTETGFTGTRRDQFEFWLNGSVGYASTHGAADASGFGGAYPNIGIEYYLNVIVPDRPAGSPGYLTFWTSPTLVFTFPNGSTKSAGFGAGGNQFSYSFNVNNYLQVGKLGVTFDPVALTYASRNLNTTDMGSGRMEKLRGGLSATFADIAAGYQVRDDLFVGLHHSFSIYSWRASDFKASREGQIGPAFTYTGLAKYGVYISGNLNFDYYTSPNIRRSVTATGVLMKVL